MAERQATGGNGAPAPRRSQRETLLGIMLVLGFALAAAGTFLLWQISDRVGDLERTGGAQGEDGAQAPLPPPTQGSARQLADDFDRQTRRLSSRLDDMLAELRAAQLEQIGPAITALQVNTAGLPETTAALNRLVVQTQGLGGLGQGLTGLRGDLGGLRGDLGGLRGDLGDLVGTVPVLTAQVEATRRGLAGTVTALQRVHRTITQTNGGLAATNSALVDATRALEEVRKSIDRNSDCLERPAICSATPDQPAGPR